MLNKINRGNWIVSILQETEDDVIVEVRAHHKTTGALWEFPYDTVELMNMDELYEFMSMIAKQ